MDGQLFVQLAVAGGLIVLTVLMHLAGIAALVALIRYHRKRNEQHQRRWVTWLTMLGEALGLFVLHGLQIFIYAIVYRAVDAIGDFNTALYFSISTYTTLGYGDVLVGADWRILAGIEAVNGLMLIGWSTAFFITIIDRMRALESEAGD